MDFFQDDARAVATETYNNCLEEKNRANGLETVRKNPRPFSESSVRLKWL